MTSDQGLSTEAVHDQLSAAKPLIVQLSRFADGSRKITSISEITGRIEKTIMMQDIFTYSFQGLDESGAAVGKFNAAGLVPEFVLTMRQQGVDVDLSVFRTPDSLH
jgi:pilus assembly protein CpaF